MTAPVSRLEITPATSWVFDSEGRRYTVTGYDADGNSLGDVTAATTLATEAGPCNGSLCTPGKPGRYTVTARHRSGASATASLLVVDSIVVGIEIVCDADQQSDDYECAGSTARMTELGANAKAGYGYGHFRVVATDDLGNLRNVSTLAEFTVTPNGHCSTPIDVFYVYCVTGAVDAGTYTITARYGPHTATGSIILPDFCNRTTTTC